MSEPVELFSKLLRRKVRPFIKRHQATVAQQREAGQKVAPLPLDLRLWLVASASVDGRRRATFGRGELAELLDVGERSTLRKAIDRGVAAGLYGPGSTSMELVLSADLVAFDAHRYTHATRS
ncbi:hypothetical protein [Arsenicicoccus dermatophilus]|uniref:hypothetical protein n=1 Tax=Arsenicicoccus dermatophilus TaxID=1076331 RepID=UPI001F4CA23C|nr:hypothetical protein [Arsenicicoccus dermatophilus]MCH8612323.1 hypothetical protein [Arsenicicoccus dermatophilus]